MSDYQPILALVLLVCAIFYTALKSIELVRSSKLQREFEQTRLEGLRKIVAVDYSKQTRRSA